MMDVGTQKSALREKMTALRKSMPQACRAQAAHMLVDHLSFFEKFAPSSTVAFYMPLADEMDPRPLARRLAMVHPLCLPIVERGQKELGFRQYDFGDRLQNGAFGVMEPLIESAHATPQILLMPLLAADATGARLGYGGGYYDHTLASLRRVGPALAIGLAYEAQVVEEVPTDARDIKLDALITEKKLREF